MDDYDFGDAYYYYINSYWYVCNDDFLYWYNFSDDGWEFVYSSLFTGCNLGLNDDDTPAWYDAEYNELYFY